jgi:ElaB/YqjD/DUF883 family membrane-anchored ribosome-binding protein
MSDIDYDRKLHQAGKDARETADQAANAANDLSQRVSSAAADAGAAVRDATRKAASVASDMGQQVYERGQRVGSGLVEQVESQPLTSVMIAAAAGFFAGLLLARR